MTSLNKTLLIGNLGRDPEIRTMQNGDKIATFSLATTMTWKDKNTGEKQEKTEWHKIAVYNQNLVDVVEKFLKKGSKTFVEGQIQAKEWTDQSGEKKYTTEIVVSRFGGSIILLSGGTDGGKTSKNYTTTSTREIDDEIPF